MRYRNEQYGFAIALPEGWTFFEKNGAKFMAGAKNEFGDKITVTVDRLSPKHKGLYKEINKIPGYFEYTKNIITKGLGGYMIDSGITDLSGNKAIWIKFAFANKSGGEKNYIIVYQIQTLKNDLIYTIIAKPAGRIRAKAFMRFAKLWPVLKKSVFSFFLEPVTGANTSE